MAAGNDVPLASRNQLPAQGCRNGLMYVRYYLSATRHFSRNRIGVRNIATAMFTCTAAWRCPLVVREVWHLSAEEGGCWVCGRMGVLSARAWAIAVRFQWSVTLGRLAR